MMKSAKVLAAVAVAGALAVTSTPAQAKSSWYFGVNTGPAWGGYYAPAPVYYAPPPPPPAYYYYPRPYYYGYPYGYSVPVNFSFGYRHH